MENNLPSQNNTEIDQALKEFEAKSGTTKEASQTPEVSVTPDAPRMVASVMKWFGIKEQRTAEYLILGFCVVAIGVSLYLFFGENLQKSKSSFSQEDLNNLPPELRQAIQNAK